MDQYATRVLPGVGGLRLSIMTGVALLAGALNCAGAPAAQSSLYEMEYVSTCASGGVSQAGSYEVITRVALKGLSCVSQTSTNYSSEPLVGYAPLSTSAVTDWSLY